MSTWLSIRHGVKAMVIGTSRGLGHAHEAELNGRYFRSIVERLGWAEMEAWRFLKGSSTRRASRQLRTES